MKINEEFQGMRLDRYVRAHAGYISQGILEKLLRERVVTVNGSKKKSSYRMQIDDDVVIPDDLIVRDRNEKRIPSGFVDAIRNCIIYEDDKMIAIDKPCGVAVQGGEGISCSIDDALPYLDRSLRIVHRLDRSTSGVMIFAKGRQNATIISDMFKNGSIQKRYIAITENCPPSQSRIIKNRLMKSMIGGQEKICVNENGKEAITRYEVLESAQDGTSLALLMPDTGRKHQLRVHMHCIGCPILGDMKYGGTRADRMYLHALELSIGKISLKAQIPNEFTRYFDRMDWKFL